MTNHDLDGPHRAMEIALTQLGIHTGSGSPEIAAYLHSVGLHPGHPWCMAFVHWCLEQAHVESPVCGAVLEVWRVCASRRLLREDALADPARLKPGMVFIYRRGVGHGHAGFVAEVEGARFQTVEGNAHGRVACLQRSLHDERLLGFLDFARAYD